MGKLKPDIVPVTYHGITILFHPRRVSEGPREGFARAARFLIINLFK